MTFFGVTKQSVYQVFDHVNNDKLDVCFLFNLGFQFVTQKGLWKVEDKCLYFPVDSLLPQELMIKMGIGSIDENGVFVGNLSGPGKRIIKTIVLTNEISQGMIFPLSLIDGIGIKNPTSEQITKFLGVKKYVAPTLTGSATK